MSAMVFAAGCNNNQPSVEYRELAGTIQKIDLNTGRVTLLFLHEKSGQYREIEGYVLPDTEIMINGRISKLADMKVGEHVSVHGRIETTGKTRRISAVKISVNRDETVSFGGEKSGGGGS